MSNNKDIHTIKLLDTEQRLYAIHLLRWKVLEVRDKYSDDELYITMNELLNEIEKKEWELIKKTK